MKHIVHFCAVWLLFCNTACDAEVKKDGWKETYPPGFKAEGSLIESESDRPYYADHWRKSLEAKKYPQVACLLADKFYDSLAYDKRSPHRDKVRGAFIDCFFQGVTNPGGSMTGGSIGEVEGFRAGKEYRHAHPSETASIMKAFGYEQIQVEGIWTVGFEHNGFKPTDRQGDDWWLWYIGDKAPGLPKDFQIPEGGAVIRVDGYLSPEGTYGHLGSYKRELLAQEMVLKTTANK